VSFQFGIWNRRDAALIRTVTILGPLVLRVLGLSWRISVVGREPVDALRDSGRRVVFAFWHGAFLAPEYVYRGQDIVVMSSLHKDGEIGTRVMVGLGYSVVRGSTSRGSTRGLIKLVQAARGGRDIAITPDGPKGPAGSVQRGMFYLSDKADATIVPVGAAAAPATELGSWDSMLIPWPFARVAIVHGAPIEPSPDRDPGERADELRDAIDAATVKAAALIGPDARGLGRLA
jgi:lysophospholipid acyltransferase (LPLAT)-like uncharacterized protein